MQTSEVLNKAADLIEERGWAQVTGWADEVSAGAPLCLEGAIQAVTGLPRHDHRIEDAEIVWLRPLMECPAYRAVQSYLSHEMALWYWNDDLERTPSDVIEVLRAAALIEAGKEHAADPWASWAVPSHLRAVTA